jgi:hypothetical protein
MRRWVVLGLIALLVGAADAGPKGKKRRGTFAKYIEPTAPDDPPRPWGTAPTWLAVALLVDRTWSDDTQLDDAKAIAQRVGDSLEKHDQVAILSFDMAIEKVMRGREIGARRKAFKRSLASVTVAPQSDIATALAQTRVFFECAPYRKVLVLFTESGDITERLEAELVAIRRSHINLLVVGLPGASWPTLRRLAEIAGGRMFPIGGYPRHQEWIDLSGERGELLDVLDDLHYD